jgi:hypothetical protein
MLFAGGEVTLARGDAAGGVGWCAPVYGQLEPTCTVRLTANSHAPFALVTWVSSGRLFKAPRLRCTPCHESDGIAVIVEISDGPRTAVFLVRSADTPHPRPLCRVGSCETDAVMLHYSTDEGRLQHLIAQGTSVCPVVRINGRDLPLSSKSTTDTLLIHGSDWLAFQAESPLTPPGRDPVQVLLATPVE